ncbi:MAG: motility protein A [Moorellales bacterium]
MRKTDVLTIVGILCGFAAILLAIQMGGTLKMFINIPSILITVVGSFSAILIHFGMDEVKSVLAITGHAFRAPDWKPAELISLLTDLARKARREGLLALEDDINRVDDPFFQKGLRMVVDAIDPEVIREVLETDIECTEERHQRGQRVYRAWASLAPAFGMIGTLIGLIQMLAKLDDPSALGPGMAVALITTFYGSIMANLLFTPLAGKLALRGEEEMLVRRLVLEGLISIQSGMNPRLLEEKLKSFLPPKVRAGAAVESRAAVGEEVRRPAY